MKKLILVMLISTAYLFIQSCGEDAPVDPNKDNYKFLYIALDSTEHWQLIEYGISEAVKSNANVTVDVMYPTKTNLLNDQLAFLNKALTGNYGGIILAPGSESLLTDSLEKAAKKYIPVVVLENMTNFDKSISIIATDNYKSGRNMAEELKAKYTGSGRILLVSDDNKNKNNLSKINGFIGVMGSNPKYENMYHLNNFQTAYSRISTALKGNDEVSVIFATNSVGASAALKAIQDLEKTGVYVLAYGRTEELISAVRDNKIYALGVDYPTQMGKVAVEQLVNYKKGNKIIKIIDPGFMVVTPENFNSEVAQKALYPKSK